jgi:hypothetical protein
VVEDIVLFPYANAAVSYELHPRWSLTANGDGTRLPEG